MIHDDLTRLITALGYPPMHENGVCHGFTLMWVQAACNHQLDAFYERLELLEQFVENPDRLVSAITNARQKVINKNPLTPEDEQLLELPAFFDGISLYQGLRHHIDLANDVYNQFRNIERISTWTRPECAPDSLHLVSCAGQYTESEFSEFLLQLARILENQPNPVLALAIPNHILGLLYKGENMFELIDTNVDKIAPSGPMTLKQCTHFLFNYAFKHDLLNKKLLIRTTAFATNPDGLPDLSFEHQKNIRSYTRAQRK